MAGERRRGKRRRRNNNKVERKGEGRHATT